MVTRRTETRARLREAIFALAAEKAVTDLTAAEVSRRAAITRDTFYRYAANPVELLAGFLSADLDGIFAATDDLPASSGTRVSVFEPQTLAVLTYVAGHAPIYRNALTPTLNPSLRIGLSAHIEASLMRHLARHPEIMPDILDSRPDPVAVAMFIGFATSGAVGAIETWLRVGDLSETTRAEQIIFASTAEWWLGRDLAQQTFTDEQRDRT